MEDPIKILVTVLGKQASEATYSLADEEFEAKLAPVALYHLLKPEQRPHKVLALCTPEADPTYKILEELLPNLEIQAVKVQGDAEPEKFLQSLFDELPDQPTELILDVTHGFRHMSFLCFLSALLLSEIRSSLQVVGAFYGAFKGPGEVAPLLNLDSLLEFSEWYSALRELQAVGSTRSLERCLESRLSKNQEQKKFTESLRQVGVAYQSALPLELGKHSCDLLAREKAVKKMLDNLPGGGELSQKILQALGRFAFKNELATGQEWKKTVPLNETELRRQADLIDALLDQANYSAAFALMREWIVSWLILGQEESCGDWLNSRSRAEDQLGAFSNLEPTVKAKLEDPGKILDLWKEVSDLRNALQHSGMRKQDVLEKNFTSRVDKIKEGWQKLVDPQPLPKPQLQLPRSIKRLMVTAMGETPGSLYSALYHLKPDKALVVTDKKFKKLALQAAKQARFPVKKLIFLLLDDATGGLEQKDKLIDNYDLDLAKAEEVVHCLTGGSTLTNFISAELADRARSMNVKVETFGLVDRRTREEQKENPYQLGQLLELKKKAKRKSKK